MIEIRNNMFQPLTFQLAGDAGSLHLGARQRETIPDEQVSEEMRRAAERGFVTLGSVEVSETSADEPTSADTGTDAAVVTTDSLPGNTPSSESPTTEETQSRRRK